MNNYENTPQKNGSAETIMTSTTDSITIEVSAPEKSLIGTQPIRIKVKQYYELVDIASQTGMNISDIASMFIDFAIKHTEIKHKVTDN